VRTVDAKTWFSITSGKQGKVIQLPKAAVA
jgi:hypothetical protein